MKNEISNETIQRIKKEFYRSLDNCKTWKTPIFYSFYDQCKAFERMHKADGTYSGRRKCDFAL